jgi:hypothetical protein
MREIDRTELGWELDAREADHFEQCWPPCVDTCRVSRLPLRSLRVDDQKAPDGRFVEEGELSYLGPDRVGGPGE